MLSRSHTGSYDWLRLCQCATDRQWLLYDLQQWSHRRSIYTRGPDITNDWGISIARAIVGNHATSGSDQRPMYDQSWQPIVRSIVTTGDRWYDQSPHPATDRTSNRGILHVTDRTNTHSWHPVTERTINCGTRRSIVRSIVSGNDRSHDKSYHRATDSCDLRPIVRSNVAIVAPNYRS